MRTGEKISVVVGTAVILINLGAAIAIGIAMDESDPLVYLGFVGFAIPIAWIAWMVRGTLRTWRTRVRAHAAGLKGRLRILRANELMGGVATVNEQPYLRLELELDLPGPPPERFSKRMIVPRLAIPAVMSGASFDVWVDPKDHRRFDVEW